MEGDRKYKHHGYMDSDAPHPGENGQKPTVRPHDGPRLPRMVQTVAAARCWNCSVPLPGDIDFLSACPKCHAALHCCRQCCYFDPSTRFQCMKPVPQRLAHKDEHNECASFKAAVTVARDSGAFPGGPSPNAPPSKPAVSAPVSRSSADARAAFDSLFKK